MRRPSPLRIALIAHLRHPIASPFMGGMEAHAHHLANALVDRGHDVTLFAAGDSQTRARLRPVVPVHYEKDMPWHIHRGTPAMTDMLDAAYGAILPELTAGDFDVIHNNTLHRYLPHLAVNASLPTVTSLHVPPFQLLQTAIHATNAPWHQVSVCSSRQKTSWWPGGAPPEAHVVANGIRLSDWPVAGPGDGTAVWSGRITATKGAHVAIDAAHALGMSLTLYGTIEDHDYYRRSIAPRLGGRIRFGGHLPQRALAAAIGRASLYLFTPLWDEPFGLAAAEAMTCGVPVAALPHGAVDEVIGRGGVVAHESTPESLAIAGQRALRLSRPAVRAQAAKRFSIDRMVDEYEDLYARAILARRGTGRALAFTGTRPTVAPVPERA